MERKESVRSLVQKLEQKLKENKCIDKELIKQLKYVLSQIDGFEKEKEELLEEIEHISDEEECHASMSSAVGLNTVGEAFLGNAWKLVAVLGSAALVTYGTVAAFAVSQGRNVNIGLNIGLFNTVVNIGNSNDDNPAPPSS